MNDHDLLIRIDEKLDELKRQFDVHLQHHFRYKIATWGIVLAAIVGLVLK